MHGARIERTGDPGPVEAIKKQPRPNGKQRREFGDNTFRGFGKLVCRQCGRPLRDHDILRPCVPIGAAV